MENSVTDYQKKEVLKRYDGTAFGYPCCGEWTLSIPSVTNGGEDITQINCPYCRQFIFLEDYDTAKK